MMNPGTPLYDRVIVRRITDPDQPKSALVSLEEKKSRYAEVVAIGQGHLSKTHNLLIPLTVKVGDRIEMPHHATGHEIKVGNETLLVIREEEILRILPSEDTGPYIHIEVDKRDVRRVRAAIAQSARSRSK